MPLALDEFRLYRARLQFFESGIESLDVSDLYDCARPASRCQQIVRLFNSGRDRFFNEQMNAAVKKRLGYRMMPRGVYDNTSGINTIEQGAVVSEIPTTVSLRDELGLRCVGVGNADQFDFGHGSQNTSMMLTKVSDTDHCHPQSLH